MYFGLTYGTVAFLDLMNRAFQNYLNSLLIVFIDYILVYSKSENENMGHLRVLFQVLNEHTPYQVSYVWILVEIGFIYWSHYLN